MGSNKPQDEHTRGNQKHIPKPDLGNFLKMQIPNPNSNYGAIYKLSKFPKSLRCRGDTQSDTQLPIRIPMSKSLPNSNFLFVMCKQAGEVYKST